MIIPKKVKVLAKKLKIRLSFKRNGKRIKKSLKRLLKEIKSKKVSIKKKTFIQKATKSMKARGTVGSFRKWCKSKKLLDKRGKVSKKCISMGLKSKSLKTRKRANFARNISKRSSFGMEQEYRKKLYQQFKEADFEPKRVKMINDKQLAKVFKKCEDGESAISFNKLIPGLYVDLGYGKCLSVQEIESMSKTRFLKDSEGRLINPFDRQILKKSTIKKINKILEVINRPTLQSFKTIDDFDSDYEYSMYLLAELRKNLPIDQQKTLIYQVGLLNNAAIRTAELLEDTNKDIKWKVVNLRVKIMTPDGWELPENMNDHDWQYAGMNMSQYDEYFQNYDNDQDVWPPRQPVSPESGIIRNLGLEFESPPPAPPRNISPPAAPSRIRTRSRNVQISRRLDF